MHEERPILSLYRETHLHWGSRLIRMLFNYFVWRNEHKPIGFPTKGTRGWFIKENFTKVFWGRKKGAFGYFHGVLDVKKLSVKLLQLLFRHLNRLFFSFEVYGKNSSSVLDLNPKILPVPKDTFWKSRFFTLCSNPISDVLSRSCHAKIVFMIIPWITIFMIQLVILRNIVPKHDPNQYVNSVEICLPVSCKLESNLSVAMPSIWSASFATGLGSCESSVPPCGIARIWEMPNWAMLPDQNTIQSVVIEALLEKFSAWKRLALFASTTNNWSRLLTHLVHVGYGFRSSDETTISRSFAI